MGDDRRALDAVYALYARRLLAFVMRHVAVAEDAEEIVQDVFIALWNNRASIRNTDTLQPLLFTAARNRILNSFRSRINSPIYEEYVETMADSIAATGTPAIEYDQFHDVVMREIDRLPSTQREVLRLARLQGLPHKEIANRLGLSVQTVTNALSVATKTLRERLRAPAMKNLLTFFVISRVFLP